MRTRWLPLTFAAATLALAGCGGSSSSGGTGTLSVGVTDAPVDDATHVVVEFTGVEIKPTGGPARDFTFATPRQIDLLALTGNNADLLLDQVQVDAGRYDWIRLMVNADPSMMDSYIELSGGGQESLTIPSGARTGLKLVSGFTVPVGGQADFTIDFDLRKSVHKPQSAGSDYMLRPALRLVDNVEVGTLTGTVAAGLVNDASCTSGDAVYVFAGAGVTPDDVDGTDPEPLTSAPVTLDSASGNFTYTVGFLSAGSYTVAFTCQAGDDDPDTDDPIAFVGPATVSVQAGATTTHDFN